MSLVTADEIGAAGARLSGRVVRTPTLPCPRLTASSGPEIVVKAENLQHTGSFKARGAQNALLARAERGRLPAGIATFSAGNHAVAAAFAGRAAGLPVVVCMPPNAVDVKVAAARRYGAEVVLTEDLTGTCHALAAERGYELLHPFDDPDVIAGAATAGAELIADAGPLDLVLVPVGGGGLISGIAAAVKTASPGTRVIGVEPATANAVTHGRRAGALVPLPHRPVSLADGLTAPYVGEHNLAHIETYVDDVIEVPEDSIAPAWWELLDTTKLLIEPSAAVGLAALHLGLVRADAGTRVALVLSGGNVAPAALTRLSAQR
ncbi:serine/threonine dehydratase [Paractinoplanes deccanensis]|uniref:Serine/threonine dehydratase n=1 Tax=Paractinoplanes deccanensis TaxID=113561 RepID=A0ABQ3XWD3_9ACTN|nr:threonine/serine dehydratase [Actinoplanes deccanensis]GID72064.1 serine/threonine dehydratase [Actinoplanes deccanensis]